MVLKFAQSVFFALPILVTTTTSLALDETFELEFDRRKSECIMAPFAGAPDKDHEFRELCEDTLRKKLVSEKFEEIQEKAQETICNGGCVDPNPHADAYELYCRAHCQAIIPASLQSRLSSCKAQSSCTFLKKNLSGLFADFQSCQKGIADGSQAVATELANHVNEFLSLPLHLSQKIAQLVIGVLSEGGLNRILLEEHRSIGGTLVAISKTPHMIRSQFQQLQCLDEEAAKYFACFLGVAATGSVIEGMASRRISPLAGEMLISTRAFELLEGKLKAGSPNKNTALAVGPLPRSTYSQVADEFQNSKGIYFFDFRGLSRDRSLVPGKGYTVVITDKDELIVGRNISGWVDNRPGGKGSHITLANHLINEKKRSDVLREEGFGDGSDGFVNSQYGRVLAPTELGDYRTFATIRVLSDGTVDISSFGGNSTGIASQVEAVERVMQKLLPKNTKIRTTGDRLDELPLPDGVNDRTSR